MSYDAALGYRMKANCDNFVFEKHFKGKKYSKEMLAKFNNLFEIRTDKYGFIVNKIGQERDYTAIANNPKIYKILVSGNSLSAGSGASCSEANWPALLENILNEDKSFKEKYDQIIVINSSGLGNNIAQEITKFQNETIYLKPNLVISLCGGRANYNYYGNPIDEIYSEQQKKMNEVFNIGWFYRQNIFYQNLRECLASKRKHQQYLDKIYPYKNSNYIKISASDLFISKIKQFNAICRSHDIDFIFVFHPVMGVGKKTLTTQEEESKKYFKRYYFGSDWEEYLKAFNQYSDHIRKNLTDKYQYDFMDLFENVSETTYTDPRHLNDHGHKIIADNLRKIAEEKIRL